MVETRLELIASDIAHSLTPSHAREVALMAVRAVAPLFPGDPLVREVVAAVEAGQWPAAQGQRAAIEAIAALLDRQYLELGGHGEDRDSPAIIEAFGRARAIDTLVMALDSDAKMAAAESLYEAHAALADSAGQALLAEVRRVLGTA